ncbi:MAG: hypothetical protein EOO73_00075 [Myxococcales bacterium]|nr:MAG: hypothetical protein EOO73_00075 [Myxococcales bacterium]
MRRLVLLGSLSLLACGTPEARTQKLNDGSWSFTCELPMEDCIRHAEKTCRTQRYRIIDGRSEVRVRDVIPLETSYYTSRLHLVCNEEDGAALLASQKTPAASSAEATAQLAPVCTTGETRECVGAAACKGGQSCLPDRSGFSPCDCGPLPLAPAAAAPSEAPLAPSQGGPGQGADATKPAAP